MLRDDLTAALRAALVAEGVEPPDVVHLERPARREHGDWSSNVALASAKAAGRNPRELGQALVDRLSATPPRHVVKVDLAGPGFVNFHLGEGWLHDVLRDVVEDGEDGYARPDIGGGERVQIEFVSANPTGPVHVGNGWFASYGDALARLLERCGHVVQREYYVNDTGGQIRRLGESLAAAKARARPSPRTATTATYVKGLAAELTTAATTSPRRGGGRPSARSGSIKLQMAQVDIQYDEWFSQRVDRGERGGGGDRRPPRREGHRVRGGRRVWLRTERVR